MNKTTKIKLICPLQIRSYLSDDFEADIISPRQASDFEGEINEFIKDYAEPPEEKRGLMTYYDESAAVNEKVISAFPSVEVKNGELVGVLTCEVAGELTTVEQKELEEWILGQFSDGYGESLEQHAIETDQFGDIYISFWNSSPDWSLELETEQNFEPNMMM